jgi:lipopolysaccharide export system protein LptC
MSSLTDRNIGLIAARQNRAIAAGARAQRAITLSFVIAGLGLALVGFFLIQAGFFGKLAPTEVGVVVKPEMPEQAVANSAEITGLDQNNQPFSITSFKSFQDKTTASLFHLETAKADVMRLNGSVINVIALKADYDSETALLDMAGSVTLAETNRFVATMDRAQLNLKTKAFMSQTPVHVTTDTATIDAQTMVVSEDGTKIKFTGQVKYRLNGDTPTGDTP